MSETHRIHRTLPARRSLRWGSCTVLALALTSLGVASTVGAQTSESRVADSSRFRPLELSAANTMRTGDGRPGKDYWQQRVDYRIAATLDPEKNEVRGKETVHYVNRSPE